MPLVSWQVGSLPAEMVIAVGVLTVGLIVIVAVSDVVHPPVPVFELVTIYVPAALAFRLTNPVVELTERPAGVKVNAPATAPFCKVAAALPVLIQ